MKADLAKEMAMAAGLRNRIVHEYDDIDPERVHEALPMAVPPNSRVLGSHSAFR